MPGALELLMGPQLSEAREHRVFGLVTAVVHAIDEGGVYRLRFLSMGDGEVSAPARVMTPMAGGERGMHFFPEVGDEVVVAFEHGDTNHPIILGGVWNNNQRPPSQARHGTENDVRTVVSRAGHELTFDDTLGTEKVTLRAKNGYELVLDTGRRMVTLKTAGGCQLVMNDVAQSVALTSPSVSVVLGGSGGAATFESSGNVTIEAAGVLTLRGNSVSIQGSTPTQIDNRVFLTHTHTGVTTGPGVSGPVGT